MRIMSYQRALRFWAMGFVSWLAGACSDARQQPGPSEAPAVPGAGGGGVTSGEPQAGTSSSASPARPEQLGDPALNAGQPDAVGVGGAGASLPPACSEPLPDPFSLSIAGEWQFTPEGQPATTIQVPGGGWVKQGFNAPSATYATRVTIPDSGGPQTTLLEFGAINHEATLSVDGVQVATNMTAFTPSVFDVTPFVRPGQEHQISLLVRGRDALKNAEGRDTVPAAAGWSPNIPQGIFRSAFVRVYPDVYVSDAFVRTSVTESTLSYDVWVTNTGAASREVSLSGVLSSWNCAPFEYPAIDAVSVSVEPGATERVTVGPIPWGLGPESYWWPNVPYQPEHVAQLHELRVSISDGSGVVHEKYVRFGFREAEQRQVDAVHAYYFLNGVRVNFRGDSLQGANYDSIDLGSGRGDAYDTLPGFLPPSDENPGFPQAVRNYQRLNFNVVRMHQVLASPYMLDVADELGLMIIDETAIRGTDNQDFVTGYDNMLGHMRALVLRDRNHASVIRYSPSNEANISSTGSVAFATDLYEATVALDPTRPVSIDVAGSGRAYDAIVRPNLAVFGHYLNGVGQYSDEVEARPDRPFGQGEFIWPVDVTPQGMMWFATATMAMRVKDASEIRPYTLLSAWASVIPGVTRASMRLEPTYPEGVINPPLYGEDNLPDPWSHPTIQRIQRAFHPLLVADLAFWEANELSNASGQWPVSVPAVARDIDLERTLIAFNDTFAGTAVTVTWSVHPDSPAADATASGALEMDVALGSRQTQTITLRTPATGSSFYLVLRAQKDGVTLFEDTAQQFTLD
jgi:hypothetical protein